MFVRRAVAAFSSRLVAKQKGFVLKSGDENFISRLTPFLSAVIADFSTVHMCFPTPHLRCERYGARMERHFLAIYAATEVTYAC
jgi:hypothetical protein